MEILQPLFEIDRAVTLQQVLHTPDLFRCSLAQVLLLPGLLHKLKSVYSEHFSQDL